MMQVLVSTHKEEAWERLSRFSGAVPHQLRGGGRLPVFMGNILGGPRAMAGLLAFFLESTFIGPWRFGRNGMPPLKHRISVCVAGRPERWRADHDDAHPCANPGTSTTSRSGQRPAPAR
jgi:hypothetical protein